MLTVYAATTTPDIHVAVGRTITDSMFLYGSMRVADYVSAVGEPVYVERFVRVPPGAPGVLHGTDDVYFMGDVKAGQGKYDADDEALAARMVLRLSAFVKTLNPNSGEVAPEWPAWTPSHRQYLEIGDTMKARNFQEQPIVDLFREQYERSTAQLIAYDGLRCAPVNLHGS
jgi:carboxylesterase type B